MDVRKRPCALTFSKSGSFIHTPLSGGGDHALDSQIVSSPCRLACHSLFSLPALLVFACLIILLLRNNVRHIACFRLRLESLIAVANRELQSHPSSLSAPPFPYCRRRDLCIPVYNALLSFGGWSLAVLLASAYCCYLSSLLRLLLLLLSATIDSTVSSFISLFFLTLFFGVFFFSPPFVSLSSRRKTTGDYSRILGSRPPLLECTSEAWARIPPDL